MTENEAIEELKENIELPFGSSISDKASRMAIKALEEIQQYRAIGTVEECREARERQKRKKPVKDEFNHDCCPNCGWFVYKDEWGGRYLPYCENCGQAIGWSEYVRKFRV